MKCFILLIATCLCGLSLNAQPDSSFVRDGNGSVTYIYDTGVEAFMDAMKSKDYKPDLYRVQLTSESGTGSQARANEVKAKYVSTHKGYNVYLIWEAPNFKVRVGDFRTKLEAAAYWKQLREEFPSAYVVEPKPRSKTEQ
jgi:hypothetical protein